MKDIRFLMDKINKIMDESVKRKGRLMYLGKTLNSENTLRHKYVELKEDNSLADKWIFNSKLFTKGSIGSVYDCSFIGSTVSYSKKQMPTSLLKDNDKDTLVCTSILFRELLQKCEEESRQTEIKLRNAKKPESELDIEIKNIRELYKNLGPSAKSQFIANLVYKIVK